MKAIQQSNDQFQQLNDELLMYSYSSQFIDSLISRNKTQSNRLNNNSQHLQLKLSKADKNGQADFLKKFHAKKQSSGRNEKGRVIKIGDATFKSNFQSGNLYMVDYIAHNTYKISMENQINSDRMSLWFYFTCSGLKGQINFIIQGFTKPRSLYNSGMKICYREVANGQLWRRGGSKINYSQVENEENQQEKKKYQLKFTFFFANSGKNVQFAYCFPYSFTRLINFIYSTSQMMVETLSKSLEGRAIPIITIGNLNSQYVILLSARVHPGQTVSSFIIEGFIKELLGSGQFAQTLKSNFLFKIVPMLNPDGVYRGNYRFSAAGCDLNRKWKCCKPDKHPEIYYWRQYILKINKEKKILMYIDIHGHSGQKNVFFYGCSPVINGVSDDRAKQFPYLMEQIYGTAYRYDYCSFAMQKDKEGTARISMFKQLQNFNVYTLESTFCGANNGNNYLQSDYFKIGNKLCQGIAIYFSDLCSHSQEKNMRIIEKCKQIKKKKKEELNSSPFLKGIGMDQQVGSESDPDTGQNTGKYDTFTETNKKTSKLSMLSPQFKKNNERQKERQLSSKLNKNNEIVKDNRKNYKNNNSQLPKKTQQQISKGRSKKNQIQFNLDIDLKKAKNRQISFNHRMTFDSLKRSKGASDLDSRIDTNQQKNNINKIGKIQSIRRKLMLEGGGAQYRRVKRHAQQFSKSNNLLFKNNKNNTFIEESLQNPIVKGLVGINNSLQLDLLSTKKSTTITPQFYPYSSHGTRKGSVQICLKKNARFQSQGRKIYINGEEIEVKCYGNKIPINL